MDLREIINNIFNTEHPIFISLLIGAVVLLLSYIFIKYALLPMKRRHKMELELKQAKLMALFAESDPNPLLSLNPNGIILNHNKEALGLFGKTEIIGDEVGTIINDGSLNIKGIVENGGEYRCVRQLNEKYYSIIVKGISELNTALVYMHDITFRHKYEENMRLFYDKLQDNVEIERKRISYELHDGIGQNITLAKLYLINKKSEKDIAEVLDGTIKELKNIARNLRPRILEEEGIKSALRLLCDNIIRETGINGLCSMDSFNRRLDEKKELLVYRIAQESLNNIAKHSKAKEFTVSLESRDDFIALSVSDNGVGIENLDLIKKNGYGSGLGLFNMKERTELLGGRFEINSLPGKGTTVYFELPVETI